MGWGNSIVGGFGQLLGAFIGVMTLVSIFIAGHIGLVSRVNRYGVASSPWVIVVEVVVIVGMVVVVVVARGSWWCMVGIVVVVVSS